jgi:hypothetical protein
LIRFDYSTFRKRVQFIGYTESKQLLELGLVSFKGVELSNVEFHNVRWLKTKFLVTRNKIIDEQLLDSNYANYEEVSKIYNQLRKNYESKLLFNEASNFFIGEMEAIRKSLWNAGTIREKMASIPYSLYQGLALYGESYFWPLIIWTPVTILTLIFLRHYCGICSVPHPHSPCNIVDQAVDSFASYFQFPRSATNTLDTVERILGIPTLGTAFIAIRRKFERVK